MNDRIALPESSTYQVGEWLVIPAGCRLSRNGTEVKVSPRSMDVLVYLAERAGLPVTNEELLDAFWIGGVTSTNAVHKSIGELRQVFGDDRHHARYIETVHKRGYRLVAGVSWLPGPALIAPVKQSSLSAEVDASPDAQTLAIAAAPSAPPRPRWHFVAALALAIVFTAWLAWLRQEGTTGASVLTLGSRSAVILFDERAERSMDDPELVRSIRDGIVARLLHQGARLATATPSSVGADNPANAWDTDYAVVIAITKTTTDLAGSLAILPASPDQPAYRQRIQRADLDPRELVDEMILEASEDLALLLDDERVAQMRAWGTQNVHAYRIARRAEAFQRITTVESLNQAVDLYREAITLDPSFSYAYESLAGTFWSIALTPPDDASREAARRGLQALARDAKTALTDVSVAAMVDRTYRMLSVGNAFDSEALWRQELQANPEDIEALRRYGELLIGANLIDESEQYFLRATALATKLGNQDLIDAIGPHYGPIADARADWERAIAIRKVSVDRFPDFTIALYSLVLNLGKVGRYAEADIYLERLRSSDPAWAWGAHAMLRAERGELAKGSQALREVIDDPRTSNATRGWVCFTVGDVECGVRYWRDFEASLMPLQWLATPPQEQYWAPGVVQDPRYQALLDELGVGRKWRSYMRAHAVEMTAVTGIPVTTPAAAQGIES